MIWLVAVLFATTFWSFLSEFSPLWAAARHQSRNNFMPFVNGPRRLWN